MSFFDILNIGSSGLAAQRIRQEVISSNIANSETPGYHAKRVDFEEKLRRVLDRTGSGISRSDPGHIPLHNGISAIEAVRAEIRDEDTPPRLNGVNNVDIDMEMARMATNQIQYAAASKVLGIRYRMLMSAIRGRG